MTKKIISMVVIAVMLFEMVNLMPVFEQKVLADTFGDFTYTDNGSTIIITRYNGSGGDVMIPSSINDKPVTSIGDYAFYNCTSLTSITIPRSVTSIDADAFAFCRGLTSITIPNSVASIGIGAFYCCGLTSITIPNSVASIGNDAFYCCNSLMCINVDNGNQYYSSQSSVLFNKSKTLLIQYPCGISGAYSVPNSVTSIGDWAFYDCSGLTSITIPNSVKSIGSYAFSSCTGLTSIIIPSSVTSTGNSAFSWCTGLISITIPSSVTSIGIYAFGHCTGLTSITIPNSVTSIGDLAFYDCTGLTIYGTKGSCAETYARNNYIKFVVGSGAGNYVPVQSISLPSTASMNVGDYITLSPTISPSNGSMQGLKWSSGNSNVAVVSNGIVDALSPGTATITVTTTDGSNISASCVVTVSSGTNYSDSGTDALRKLALSNFIYNNLDSPVERKNNFIKYYNIGLCQNMFNANGEFIKWDKLYQQTIYNHRVLASSGDNGFSNYIQNMLSKNSGESGFVANTYSYTTWSSKSQELAKDNGFYAAAFKDETGKIIIAYKGTDDILDKWQDVQLPLLPSQCLSAVLFYDYIKNEFPTSKIEVTGHSLGGALADYVSMYCNVPSTSFNAPTGWIFKETYVNQSNYIKAFKGIGPNDWGFKRCINIDSQNVGDNAFNVAVALKNFEYTNDYLINGNGYGYDNSLACYSHSLQSMLHYDNGTGRFSISNSSVVSSAKSPWKKDNLYMGISGDDTLTVETGFLNQKEASTLYTGNGNDTVYGGNRNDTIYAIGSGHKDLYGGLGDDTYILDADMMDSEVNISDPSGNDKILLKGNININTYFIQSDGSRYILNLGGNKVIKVNINRNGGSPKIKLTDSYGRMRDFIYGGQTGGGGGAVVNMLSANEMTTDTSIYTPKTIHLGGVVSVSVYDTNNELLGTYSNTSTKVEIANWGYFYSTNDSTGTYMNIDIINGNYVLKVTSTGAVDYSVYDPGASTGGTAVYEQKGIDLSGGSVFVINSDFSTAVNKFSLNNSGNVTLLTATGYTNAQQITLSSTDISLAAGTSATVSATILPNNVVTKSVNWTIIQPIDAPPIAGVVTNADGSATVMGISTGTATLCAIATDESGVNAQIPITVTQADAPIVSTTADGAGYASDTFTSANIVTITATLPVGFDKVCINFGGNTYEQTSVDITDEGGTDVKVYAFNSTTGEKSKTADFIVKIDRTAPVISGVADGAKYYIDKHVNVSDEFISSVTVNGTAFTTDEMNSGKWISQQGTYSIKATDLSGKETDVSFTINPLPEINTMTKDDFITLQGIRTEFEETKYTLPDDRKTILEQSISVLESKMVILLNDGFDLLISNISSTGSQITVSVLNLTGTVANGGLLVLSAYNTDNKLIEIKTQRFVNGQEQYVFNLNISQAYSIKAFLCDGLANIKPISSARTSFVADGAVIALTP